ncbi:P-loop containing nucleoside triphosphate hydrolase protein [Phascolomyces articulosus]|uniref:P-loop containing nucleoside triphosphate hydrolase protein n=1 Tax=Phascolomyces articulosus TaxID=60185 RepID=A0AAD5JZL2_9FUNG|nr:P-loop containing nucleoside triphosphate hydrolase protein [Phascolomyces articulosus]
MAPLEIIGAGQPRCGTDSLREALNLLGYNTHHMRSMFECDRHPEAFEEAYLNPEKETDWNWVYDGFNAGVDCPTVSVIDQLLKYYPNAKVILTKRDADSWHKSVLNTIYKFHDWVPENAPDYMVRNRKMAKTIFMDGAFQDMQKFKDEPEFYKARYEEHNKWVMENVPKERLLVLDLNEGITWEKICPFLDKPIPSQPYPHANSTKEITEHFVKMQEQSTGPKKE